jgi:hypothetical protein
MQFLISTTDEVLIPQAGLGLVGALLQDTKLRQRVNAIDVEGYPTGTLPVSIPVMYQTAAQTTTQGRTGPMRRTYITAVVVCRPTMLIGAG